MTFKELKENDKLYAYIDDKLVKTYIFKEFLTVDRSKAKQSLKIYDTEKLNNAVLILNNVNQSVCSMGNKKISTKELK